MSNSLLVRAESAITLALYERLKLYAPNQSGEIVQALNYYAWGRKLIEEWDASNKQYIHIWDSLGETIEQEPEPLVSLFSQLSIVKKQEVFYYEPVHWNVPVQYPIPTKPNNESIKEYWRNIGNAWVSFIEQSNEEVEQRIYSFLDWSDTWLASVPVSSELNSVPLSMHFRLMTSLINICDQNEAFQLVLGDVSGIQKYLMDIAHIGAGKVAKRLRARSFALGLLADGAAHDLLLRYNVPMFNLLLSAGGLFYAIIPSDISIEDWQNETNKRFYEKYQGFIGLNTAAKQVKLSELNHSFPTILSELYKEIQRVKGSPFANVLIDNFTWSEEPFIHHYGEKEPCNSCRKFPQVSSKNNVEGFCESCMLDEKIGRILPKAKYLIFKRDRGMVPIGTDLYVDVVSELPSANNDGYFIQVWNQAKSQNITLPFQRKWVANYIPLVNASNISMLEKEKEPDEHLRVGDPLTFGQIAKLGKGKDMVGILKADVDYLGMLFSVGLENDSQKQPHTFSHISTLSKLMERFFSGGVNKLLEEEYQLTYTVFSGGDDLFLVGPWDEILMVAEDVRNKFKRYTLNPEVSLSAGIDIIKPKFPITQASHRVEELLELAKDQPNGQRLENGNESGRNQVNLIGTIMEWSDFKDLRGESIRIANWWNEKKLSSSFLYQLVNFSEMYKKYKEANHVPSGETIHDYLKFIPMLHYSIRRNLIEANDTVITEFSKDKEESIGWANSLKNIDDPKIQWFWEYIRVIIRLSSFYREGV